MRYPDLLGAAAQTLANRDTNSEDIATVTAVRDDGSVNVMVRGGLLPGVPALASYAPRAKGDIVVVRRTVAGLYVVGKTGGIPEPPPPTPPPATDPTTVQPTGGDAYRAGRARDDVNYPIQGDWGGWGANEGVWVYGTALATAMNAGTVTKASVTLTRSSVPHGDYGDVPVHLYTHASTSLPTTTPPGIAGPWIVGSLQLGEKDDFDLPAGAIASLQGSGRGLLVYSGSIDYIRFIPAGATCGAVYIEYE